MRFKILKRERDREKKPKMQAQVERENLKIASFLSKFTSKERQQWKCSREIISFFIFLNVNSWFAIERLVEYILFGTNEMSKNNTLLGLLLS